MKTKIKLPKEILDASRIALQTPLSQFMEEVGQRMDRREAEKKQLPNLVEKRTIK